MEEGLGRSLAARNGGRREPGGAALALLSPTAGPAPAAAVARQDLDTTSIPFSATINGYKQRCAELEEEVAVGLAAAAAQRVEAEALRTKVAMLTEACRSLDAQLGELRRRSAAEAATSRPPALPSSPAAKAQKPTGTAASPPWMVPELAKLLRAACRQLEEARRVGSALQSRLGTATTSGGGKQGFTCA